MASAATTTLRTSNSKSSVSNSISCSVSQSSPYTVCAHSGQSIFSDNSLFAVRMLDAVVLISVSFAATAVSTTSKSPFVTTRLFRIAPTPPSSFLITTPALRTPLTASNLSNTSRMSATPLSPLPFNKSTAFLITVSPPPVSSKASSKPSISSTYPFTDFNSASNSSVEVSTLVSNASNPSTNPSSPSTPPLIACNCANILPIVLPAAQLLASCTMHFMRLLLSLKVCKNPSTPSTASNIPLKNPLISSRIPAAYST